MTLLTKASEDPLRENNSYWAQGGIIYKSSDPDEQTLLAADVKRAGAGQCKHEAVAKLAAEGPGAVEAFLLGPNSAAEVPFDRVEPSSDEVEEEDEDDEDEDDEEEEGKKEWGPEEPVPASASASASAASSSSSSSSSSSKKKKAVVVDKRPYALCVEASHSRPRIVHWRDHTGRAIMESLLASVRAHPNIDLRCGATAATNS